MITRKYIRLFLTLTCVSTALMVVKYVHFMTRQYSPVSAKLKHNIRDFNPTTTSQRNENTNLNQESIDKGACAIPMVSVNESPMAYTEGCKLPNLDPYHPHVMRAIKPVTSLNCTGRLFTEYGNKVFRLLDDVSEEHQIAEVFAQPIYRDSDFNITLGGKKFLNLTNRETSVSDDFLEVTVRFRDGCKQTELHASVSEIHDVAQRRETHRAPLNIMILTFDGTSAAHFERMLPKTHTYLKDELDSIIFKGYSIVGESTTPAMSAFLTGKSLEENCKFREARKDVKNASFVDEWPLIFKDLKHLGIATMWSEDQPQIGAFHLRLKGFKDQPTDHYGRTLWLKWNRLRVGARCLNSQPQYELQLNYLKSFMKSYLGKRKFGFTFFSDLCHRKVGLLSAADSGLVSFFESLKHDNLLNETMFITMSDHGARFKEVRQSPQGKLEHRLPFLSLTFPRWFKRNYPEHVAALVKNTRIITSPFDLHATMKHLLTFPEKRLVEGGGIGTSLFEPLPENRACEDTGIPDNYCPCLRWQSIDINHPHVHEAVKVAVSHINELLASHSITTKLCHQLELKAIFEAYQKLPSSQTHLNLDRENVTCSYQIQFQTTPGDGLFEGLLRMSASGDFKVYGEIDRVNMYGDQPRCVAEYLPSMRPYCLCKSQ